MIQYILVFTYFFSTIYINLKHSWCIYTNTCARLKYNNNIQYIYDLETLRLNYENQYIINTYFCKSMNNTYKKILCTITKVIDIKDFQKIQTVINKLYNMNYIICYNKNKIFDSFYSINMFCSDYETNESSILDLSITIIRIILNYIHDNNLYIITIFISYLILSDEYDRLYPINNEKNLDEYSEITEYISDNCSICLNEYSIQDTIRKLKVCNHIYHETCINEWVDKFNNETCPLCRTNIKV